MKKQEIGTTGAIIIPLKGKHRFSGGQNVQNEKGHWIYKGSVVSNGGENKGGDSGGKGKSRSRKRRGWRKHGHDVANRSFSGRSY